MIYDLAVIGGGTSGCAAAYIAGKYGLKVIVIEKNIHLGGTITSGLVVPVMYSGDNQINKEFYNDLITEMHNIGGQITYQNNSGWFNPELVKIVLDSMLQKYNVDIRFSTTVCDYTLTNNTIKTIYINKENLSVYNGKIQNIDKTLFEPIEARYIIDATGNCEFGKILNCKFLNNKNKFQPASLRFIMSGVDLDMFSKWLLELDTDRTVTSCENVDGQVHLSTAYTWDTDKTWALAPIFDKAVQDGCLKDTDRNYFQVFTVAGMPDSIAFNCPRTTEDYDYNSTKDISKCLISLRQAIFRISKFCKKYLPGFKNAYISNIADSLGIRVSNRIEGKYVYTIEDLKSGKTFDNPVLISNYPVDVHSTQKDNSTLDVAKGYQLPIEALMSKDYDNLFVAGRCLSADYLAQGALRVQTSCFSMGEAIAKYIVKIS